jgi:hypothetical protein
MLNNYKISLGVGNPKTPYQNSREKEITYYCDPGRRGQALCFLGRETTILLFKEYFVAIKGGHVW